MTFLKPESETVKSTSPYAVGRVAVEWTTALGTIGAILQVYQLIAVGALLTGIIFGITAVPAIIALRYGMIALFDIAERK